MSDGRFGYRIGPRIAALVSQALIATHKGLASAKHTLAMTVFRSMSDEISHEVDLTIGPVLRMIYEHPDLPSDLKQHLQFMAHGHGQLKAIVGSSLSGASLLSPLATITANLLNPLVLNAVAAAPNAVPDPGTIADIAAKGFGPRAEMRHAMKGQGFDDAWTDALFESALNYPDMSLIWELLRRGKITLDMAHSMAERLAIPGESMAKIVDLYQAILSPADAALAVLRGNMSQQDGEKTAAMSGVDATDFNILVGNTGEPPGLMQMLEAYRRGFIDKATLEKGILQSRYRNEWVGMLEQLRYSPMPTADAVQAVVQNQISNDDGKRIADANGLEPGHWDALVRLHGEPLSRTEMNQLYNRGLMTAAQVKQGLRESRMKDRYVDLAFALKDRLIPERTIVTLLHHGAINHADAVKRLRDIGYDSKSAELLVKEGTSTKTAGHKELAVGTITALYEDRAISHGAAVAMLEKLKYDKTEADFIIQVADLKAKHRLTQQAISVIRSRYISRHISRDVAIGELDRLSIATDQRDQTMKMWDIEIQVSVKTLTQAQVIHAMKKGIITKEDATARLLGMGYSATDAGIIVRGA